VAQAASTAADAATISAREWRFMMTPLLVGKRCAAKLR
jgi:hypothetical protein